MKTATKVRDLDNFTGMAALYKLSKPLKGYDYVAVSAAWFYAQVETYIFPSNENGEVVDWGELPGSQCGVYNHETVLNDAGYEVKND
jgi:hypothetical protein